jgi:hypothetical protein
MRQSTKNWLIFGILLLIIILIGVFLIVYFLVIDKPDNKDSNSNNVVYPKRMRK